MSNRTFKKTYWNDAAAFVHDCIEFKEDESPVEYQVEILSKITTERKVSVRGPHGLGKTTLASWLILWFSLTRDGEDWKCPTTASAWRQLTKYLWPEVHKWSHKIKWDRIGREPWRKDKELLQQSIKGSTGEAFAIASSDHVLIEGAHADHLFYMFDEAKAIPNDTWDAAEGAFASGEVYALAISTPGDRSGRFYDIHRKRSGLEDWYIRHVKLDEAIRAGRISQEWADSKRRLWGEKSPMWQARGLGEFPKQSSDSLFNLQFIEYARENEIQKTGELKAALDVARYGTDDSVYGQRDNKTITKIITLHGNDLMRLAGLVKAEGVECIIDEIGIGAGVVDRLKEQRFPCYGLNVSESAIDNERFLNKRAEMYFNLSEELENKSVDLTEMSQADYDRLSGELTSIKYIYTSKGQYKIEPKADMKKRLGCSPDMADKTAMLYYNARVKAVIGVEESVY